MPDLAKLHYSGLLSGQVRNAAGLEAILSDFLKLPVVIEEFIGHWMELPEEGRFRLGESPATGALGTTTLLGACVWDCQSKFRVLLGPLDLTDYLEFLPGGEGLKRLSAIVKNYIGDELSWDLNLIMKRKEVPPIRLGLAGQLGWTTIMTESTPEEDMDDLLLNPYFKTN